MNLFQATLSKTVEFNGVGLHSGEPINLTISPAPANTGIHMKRIDIPNSSPIQVHIENVKSTTLCTVVGKKNYTIATVEHLMAALVGLGIDNAFICVTGPELPILDGSSAVFVDRFIKVGITPQKQKRKIITVYKKIQVQQGDQYMIIEPFDKKEKNHSQLEIHCSIDFPRSRAIGSQTISSKLSTKEFMNICNARTFCHIDDVNHMRSQGLALGGSLENAIVVDKDHVLNPEGLRCKKEFAKHKLLDCIGDLGLLGAQLTGKITVHKGGHSLHVAFVKKVYDHINQHQKQEIIQD